MRTRFFFHQIIKNIFCGSLNYAYICTVLIFNFLDMEKDLLKLNSIKSDLLAELAVMYVLTKNLGRLLRSYERSKKKGKRLELLNLVCEKMEDNFINMENVCIELSNFINRISCKK